VYKSTNTDAATRCLGVGYVEVVGGVLYDVRVEYQRSSLPDTYGYLNVTWGWEGVAQVG
jgi:hypothetical protein